MKRELLRAQWNDTKLVLIKVKFEYPKKSYHYRFTWISEDGGISIVLPENETRPCDIFCSYEDVESAKMHLVEMAKWADVELKRDWKTIAEFAKEI